MTKYTGKELILRIVAWVGVLLVICGLVFGIVYRIKKLSDPVYPPEEESVTEAAGTTQAPAGTTAEMAATQTAGNETGTTAGTQTGLTSGTAPLATTRPAATTKPEQNMDDTTRAVTTASWGPGTSEPVDRTSLQGEQTSGPDDPTSHQAVTTRTPVTTRDPYVTTKSPESTTAPHTNYTPDPAITVIPPTTMPDGRRMTIGDRIEDVTLIAPDGTPVHGYWEMEMDEAEFIVDLPHLAEGETCRGWSWVPYYHFLEAGTYEGRKYGLVFFTPDVILPPYTGTEYTRIPTTIDWESGDWW